ncbi:MAG: hypothetical protein IRY86_10130 [Thermorudis peleae]|nr:hypothetical protein [Thermorudis peleae]
MVGTTRKRPDAADLALLRDLAKILLVLARLSVERAALEAEAVRLAGELDGRWPEWRAWVTRGAAR